MDKARGRSCVWPSVGQEEHERARMREIRTQIDDPQLALKCRPVFPQVFKLDLVAKQDQSAIGL
jgi:hypothetical protein